MKKLTSAESIITIRHYQNFLASEGIVTEVRNDVLGSIVGEMPFVETWPQLWVVNDLDFDRAKQLLESADTETSTAPWHCHRCGEENEGQFAACWNCGTPTDN